jgi:hypothetical protein
VIGYKIDSEVSFEVRTTIKELMQLISRKAATHALLVIIFPTQTLFNHEIPSVLQTVIEELMAVIFERDVGKRVT